MSCEPDARGQWAVRGNRHVELAAHGDRLAFILTVEQVVVALHIGELRPAIRFGSHLQVVELVGEHFASPQGADFSNFDERIERL